MDTGKAQSRDAAGRAALPRLLGPSRSRASGAAPVVRRFATRLAALAILGGLIVAVSARGAEDARAASGWTDTPQMPIGRGGAAVVASGSNTIYVIGGFANYLGDSNLNLRMTVNGELVAYSFMAPAPTPRSEMSAAESGGVIFVAGGRTRGGTIPPYNVRILDAFESYNVSDDTWQTLAPMPTKRAGLALAVVGSKVYAIGGRDGGQGILKNGNVLDTVEVYDINAGTWSTGPSMPTPRSDMAAVVHGTDIYVIGGWDGSSDAGGDLQTVEILSTTSGTWSAGTPMPTARTALTATTDGSVLYAIGGHTGAVSTANELGTVEAFDTGADAWHTVPCMNSVRAQAGAAVAGSSVYAVGGRFYPQVSGSASTGARVEMIPTSTYGGGCGDAQLATGSYVGDGADGRSIAAVGFQPDVVIVKGDTGEEAVIRTSSMTGDAAKQLVGSNPLKSNRIESLDADGFTVGSDKEVNRSGKTYYYLAFRAASNHLAVGSYTGNGASSQSIAGLGYSPESIWLLPEDGKRASLRLDPMTESFDWDNHNGDDDVVTSLDSDGFTVGDSDKANKNGKVYYYVAFNNVAGSTATGSYTGNGADNRSITGAGFAPNVVFVRPGFNKTMSHKTSAMPSGDWTLRFDKHDSVSDYLQALESDGFQVGTRNEVNKNNETYYWWAFGG